MRSAAGAGARSWHARTAERERERERERDQRYVGPGHGTHGGANSEMAVLEQPDRPTTLKP